MSTTFLVAVYLCDRRYGGPEEGGWYYDCGDLVRIVRLFHDRAKAYRFSNALNERLKATLNKGRAPLHSVLSQGLYRARVERDNAPAYFPVSRPRYE